MDIYFFKMNKWQLHEIGLFINTDVIWFDFLMLKLVILLAVSIYIYSLLSKIDVASLTDACLHICVYIYIASFYIFIFVGSFHSHSFLSIFLMVSVFIPS